MSAQKKKPEREKTQPHGEQKQQPEKSEAATEEPEVEPADEPVTDPAAEPAADAATADTDLSVVAYPSTRGTLDENSAASFESSAFPVQTGTPDYFADNSPIYADAQADKRSAEAEAAGRSGGPDGWLSAGSPAQEAAPEPASFRDTAPSPRRGLEAGPEPAAALTADRLLEHRDRPPIGGWRLWLYKVTLGYLNVGDSDKVRINRALEHRIAVRLGERTRYVPVLSRKGGVGKTTITTLLGMVLADIREDRIIAMDANPDRGTLSDRSPGRADFTARQLVNERFNVDSFAQLSSYVAREGSRLDVLASDTDPTVAQAFDEVDYRAVTEILGRYYSIVLTDSGTGMVHSVMKGTLEKADTVVLVSGGSVDEARLASETLSWLQAHGRDDLVAKAIVVINMSSGEGHLVDVNQIEEHFSSRVKTVIRIPYDRHLAEGSRVELAKLRPATRTAVTELAALVIDELQN